MKIVITVTVTVTVQAPGTRYSSTLPDTLIQKGSMFYSLVVLPYF